jgi:hypothetical protein
MPLIAGLSPATIDAMTNPRKAAFASNDDSPARCRIRIASLLIRALMIGKQIGMMRPRCTEYFNYPHQCSIHADAHIIGSVASQIDSIRIILASLKLAHFAAAACGQRTVTLAAPR